jgi:hypothetical protein
MMQQRVGAMLVSRRVWVGCDGSAIFILDKSRSAATSLFGLAFFEDWSMSPWSLLLEGDKGTSLMHRCVALQIGAGVHVDVSDLVDAASPVERRLFHEAVAGGLRSIYMLHAADGLVVQFASWNGPGAFHGVEAELGEYADAHVVNVSVTAPKTDLVQASLDIAVAMIRLDHFPMLPNALDRSHCSSVCSSRSSSTESSVSSLISFAESTMHLAQKSNRYHVLGKATADIVSALPLHHVTEVLPRILEALPMETLADLAPAVLLAVPPELIAAVLPATIELLPPTIAIVPSVVRTVVAALPMEQLAHLLPAVLLAVPPELIGTVLPGALELLPATIVARLAAVL